MIKLKRYLAKNRDVLVVIIVTAAIIALLYHLYSSFGLSVVFLVVLSIWYYKLLAFAVIAFGLMLVVVGRRKEMYIVTNYALLAFYLILLILVVGFVGVAFAHFSISIDDVAKYLSHKGTFFLTTKWLLYFVFISQMIVFIIVAYTLILRTKSIALDIILKKQKENCYSLILDYVSSDEKDLKEIVDKIRKELSSGVNKRVFFELLNQVNSRFKGEFKLQIQTLFHELGMFDFVFKRLNSWKIRNVVWAVRSLAALDDVRIVKKLQIIAESTSKKPLWLEVILALIQLKQVDLAINLLVNSRFQLTEYDSLIILNGLLQSNTPAFDLKPLYSKDNKGLLILALNLNKEYQQVSLVEESAKLLKYQDEKVVQVALRTLISIDPENIVSYMEVAFEGKQDHVKMSIMVFLQPFFTSKTMASISNHFSCTESDEFKLLLQNIAAEVEARYFRKLGAIRDLKEGIVAAKPEDLN